MVYLDQLLLSGFKKKGYNNLLLKIKQKLNLLNQLDTFNFVVKFHAPHVIIMAMV